MPLDGAEITRTVLNLDAMIGSRSKSNIGNEPGDLYLSLRAEVLEILVLEEE